MFGRIDIAYAVVVARVSTDGPKRLCGIVRVESLRHVDIAYVVAAAGVGDVGDAVFLTVYEADVFPCAGVAYGVAASLFLGDVPVAVGGGPSVFEVVNGCQLAVGTAYGGASAGVLLAYDLVLLALSELELGYEARRAEHEEKQGEKFFHDINVSRVRVIIINIV